MGEPLLSDAADSDRRSAPRFPADLLGKASVRLLGGSEVTLINFSERGILFQSETRLLVGARGTVRIVVGTETTVAAGTVVRSLVQGMASGKLAFHTALALDQPLPLATAVEVRERARIAAEAKAAPVEDAVADEPPMLAVADMPVVSGKTIEKRSHKGPVRLASSVDAPPALVIVDPPALDDAPAIEQTSAIEAIEVPVGDETSAFEDPSALTMPFAFEPEPEDAEGAPTAMAPTLDAPASNGFDSGFADSGSFGWSVPAAEPVPAGLSVLFVSTTKERSARVQSILASHRRDIVLTTVMHSKAETLAELGRQHEVLLFDLAIGPEALERTLLTLRQSPLGASIAVYVPQQTALPPSVAALANACVIDTASGDMLVAALRDAAWTPWQPVELRGDVEPGRDQLFWKAFDALPVPVIVVDAAGEIRHANDACSKLVAGDDLVGKALASFFVADDGPAIAKLIADGLAGGYEDTPVFTAPADGKTVQVVLQALSVLPGAGDRAVLALRCELRAEPIAPEPELTAPVVADLAEEVAALTSAHDELTRIVDASRHELTRVREELDETRAHGNGARRERDELRGQLEIAQRDLERARELERAGAARITELERMVADAARTEAAAARAQSLLAATSEEVATLRTELDALRLRTTTQGAEAERTAVKYAAIETSSRQATEELKIARADVVRLTRERDQSLAAVEAERARAEAAISAARDDGKKPRKIVPDEPVAASTARLQRQLDDLRAEVKREQDARRELEDLLDQNAENLEQTIQDYEAKLDALGAGVDDKRPKPKKASQG